MHAGEKFRNDREPDYIGGVLYIGIGYNYV